MLESFFLLQKGRIVVTSVYVWKKSLQLCCEHAEEWSEKLLAYPVIVTADEGSGVIQIDGHEYILANGSCFLFAPGTKLRFCNREKTRLSVHVIEFERV